VPPPLESGDVEVLLEHAVVIEEEHHPRGPVLAHLESERGCEESQAVPSPFVQCVHVIHVQAHAEPRVADFTSVRPSLGLGSPPLDQVQKRSPILVLAREQAALRLDVWAEAERSADPRGAREAHTRADLHAELVAIQLEGALEVGAIDVDREDPLDAAASLGAGVGRLDQLDRTALGVARNDEAQLPQAGKLRGHRLAQEPDPAGDASGVEPVQVVHEQGRSAETDPVQRGRRLRLEARCAEADQVDQRVLDAVLLTAQEPDVSVVFPLGLVSAEARVHLLPTLLRHRNRLEAHAQEVAVELHLAPVRRRVRSHGQTHVVEPLDHGHVALLVAGGRGHWSPRQRIGPSGGVFGGDPDSCRSASLDRSEPRQANSPLGELPRDARVADSQKGPWL
jgi:hypothetical protein